MRDLDVFVRNHDFLSPGGSYYLVENIKEAGFDLLCRLVPRTCLPAGRRTKVATI